MGMAAILLNGAEPFEQIVNYPFFNRMPYENYIWYVKSSENCSSCLREEDILRFYNFIQVYSTRARAHISQWFRRMSKIGFQDGSCGGHLRSLIKTILYTFDVKFILLLQPESPDDSGADVKNQFPRWCLWFSFWDSIQYDFSYFYVNWLACCPS